MILTLAVATVVACPVAGLSATKVESEKEQPLRFRGQDHQGLPISADLPPLLRLGFVPNGVFKASCSVCQMHGPGATRLYTRGRNDGLGATLQAIIFAMAEANMRGMSFGGIYRGDHRCHGVSMKEAVQDFFNLKDGGEVFIPWSINSSFFDYKVLREKNLRTNATQIQALRRGSAVLFEWSIITANVAQLTPDFLAALRSQVGPGMEYRLQQRSQFGQRSKSRLVRQSQRLTVAIHIRRGDVDGAWVNEGLYHIDRYTPDSWYFEVVEKIRQHSPDADIHAWSAVNEGRHAPDEFDGYISRNITMHLDGDPLDAWAHMSTADVFVMARSSFSHIPALLNPSCVLYQPYWHHPIPDWTVVKMSSPNFDSDLQACIERAWRTGPRRPPAPEDW